MEIMQILKKKNVLFLLLDRKHRQERIKRIRKLPEEKGLCQNKIYV
jgi:hypothetical protein